MTDLDTRPGLPDALRDREAPELHRRAGSFLDVLGESAALLDRHLPDEEDLIVPVLLKHGPGGPA